MKGNAYLTALEWAEQIQLKSRALPLFDYDITVTAPNGQTYHLNGQVYAADVNQAEQIRGRIAHRFIHKIKEDLADKSFGFLFPKEKRMRIRDYLLFRFDKNPVFRRSATKSMFPSGIKIGELTRATFKGFKEAKKTEKTDIVELSIERARKLRHNILWHIRLYSIGLATGIGVLLSAALYFDSMTSYEVFMGILFSIGAISCTTLAIATSVTDYKKLAEKTKNER